MAYLNWDSLQFGAWNLYQYAGKIFFLNGSKSFQTLLHFGRGGFMSNCKIHCSSFLWCQTIIISVLCPNATSCFKSRSIWIQLSWMFMILFGGKYEEDINRMSIYPILQKSLLAKVTAGIIRPLCQMNFYIVMTLQVVQSNIMYSYKCFRYSS